jgi:hypothetical protein
MLRKLRLCVWDKKAEVFRGLGKARYKCKEGRRRIRRLLIPATLGAKQSLNVEYDVCRNFNPFIQVELFMIMLIFKIHICNEEIPGTLGKRQV